MAIRASRTAVLVCQGRAVADALRPTERFSDPVAVELLRPDERVVVDRVVGGEQPTTFGERAEYELIKGTAEIMVPRTVRIDEAVVEHAAEQVVLLGAGLDTRAWRMPELSGATVFEVDHPASQQDKKDRIGGREPLCGRLVDVPVDLRHDPLGDALSSAGYRQDVPTTWVWEGVVPYLTRDAVARTAQAIAGLSAPRSRLVVNYQEVSLVARAGRLLVHTMLRLARRPNPMTSEPWRSWWTPDQMRELLAPVGFTIRSDDDLRTIAVSLGLGLTAESSLRNGHVLVADC